MSDYSDIIHLPHPVSPTRKRMSAEERAGQFAPFAALTGFGAVITETARVTDERIELDEGAQEELDARLQILREHLPERPPVAVTYFVPDGQKSGGAYVTALGEVKKLDLYERRLILTDGSALALDDIYTLDGEIFEGI